MEFLAAACIALGLVALSGWTSFGRSASGERLARKGQAENWRRGRFRNALPLRNHMWRALWDGVRSGSYKIPKEPIQVHPNDGSAYEKEPSTGLRITWLGHSSLLLELDGARFLVDPIWGERVSPFTWMGPKRWYQSPIAIENLPPIDAVLISHDHYDHLDHTTINLLKNRVNRFVVPLGVGAHLEYWGVDSSHITEIDWWDEVEVGGVNIVATPARHASGRHLFDVDKTLWCGFACLGSHRVYYSGDSGLFPGFKDIGERLGPFDLAMIETGAYSRNWPDWHLGPEQAVIANQWVKGRRLLPLHWGLFNLSIHNWTEPMERVLAASAAVNVAVVTPRPGQPFEPGVSTYEKWWPDVPWRGPEHHSVKSSQLPVLDDHESALIDGHHRT